MTYGFLAGLPWPLRYGAVGGGTFLVYLVLSLLLVHGAGMHPSFAATISVVVSSAVNYLGHATVTFHGKRQLGRSIGRYLMLVAGNSALTGVVVASLHHRIGLSLANAAALVLITLASYLIMDKWVMRAT